MLVVGLQLGVQLVCKAARKLQRGVAHHALPLGVLRLHQLIPCLDIETCENARGGAVAGAVIPVHPIGEIDAASRPALDREPVRAELLDVQVQRGCLGLQLQSVHYPLHLNQTVERQPVPLAVKPAVADVRLLDVHAVLGLPPLQGVVELRLPVRMLDPAPVLPLELSRVPFFQLGSTDFDGGVVRHDGSFIKCARPYGSRPADGRLGLRRTAVLCPRYPRQGGRIRSCSPAR